jgi:bifunctional ADP-heptose synthase (sugar kinase/adenylyltransferase)
MSRFRASFGAADVADLLDRMRGLSVLVVGDTILDDYHFCRTLGTSSKDPALAVLHESSEMFAGGVLAVANHVANFSDDVRLVTVLGEDDGRRDFIDSKLGVDIARRFVAKPGAPTTLKRRFIDAYFVSKLFEVYEMDDSALAPAQEDELHELLASEAKDADLVLVADFGHGTLSDRTRAHLVEVAPFLAVNTQANAGNRGFHTIGAYSRANYASLSEGEIRLEYRDMRGMLAPMMKTTAERLGARALTVTRGQKGCLVRGSDGDVVEIPSFTPRIIDRVGAGDALFAITSMAACLDAPPELLGFVGNVVGGLAVEVLGNKKSIDRANVDRFLDPLLA